MRMDNPLGAIKISASLMETPFTIRQVETHLVFGPIGRYVPFGYIFFVGGLVSLIACFFTPQNLPGGYVIGIIDKVFFLVVAVLILQFSRRQQAIIGWAAVKSAIGITALTLATVGAGLSFQRGYTDAWPDLFLGLIWIPGVEFIPKITPHQRFVTLARIALSMPCIYLGVKSGNWH